MTAEHLMSKGIGDNGVWIVIAEMSQQKYAELGMPEDYQYYRLPYETIVNLDGLKLFKQHERGILTGREFDCIMKFGMTAETMVDDEIRKALPDFQF